MDHTYRSKPTDRPHNTFGEIATVDDGDLEAYCTGHCLYGEALSGWRTRNLALMAPPSRHADTLAAEPPVEKCTCKITLLLRRDRIRACDLVLYNERVECSAKMDAGVPLVH